MYMRTILASLVLLVTQTVSAEDLAGRYVGILPCADCPAIELRIDLNADGRFIERMVYRERDSQFLSSGRWSRMGEKLMLSACNGENDRQLGIGETDRLTLLDQEGNPIKSPFNFTLYRSTLLAPLKLSEDLESCDQAATPKLTGTLWHPVELGGQRITQPTAPHAAYLQFTDDSETRVTGSTGCNRLMGDYVQEANKLHFTALATTRMACPDMTQEQVFIDALNNTTGWQIENDELVLNGEHDHVLARFRRSSE